MPHFASVPLWVGSVLVLCTRDLYGSELNENRSTMDPLPCVRSLTLPLFSLSCKANKIALHTLLLQVPCLEQALAIMALHSNLFSVYLMRSLMLPNCSAHELRLSIKVVLCLPLLHLPSIFPVMNRCSKPFCRQTCLKNVSCLLIVLINDLSRLASFRTASIYFFFA